MHGKSHRVGSSLQRSSNHPPKTPHIGKSLIQETAMIPPSHLMEGDFCFGFWEVGGLRGERQRLAILEFFFRSIPSVFSIHCVTLIVDFSGSTHCH